MIRNSPAQQSPKPPAPNDSNRTHSPNHVLRVLADFPYLINYVYDDDGVEVESCFTLKDIKTRKDVFLSHLREILDSSPKYEHLLSIIDGKAEGNYQPQDKLVVGSAHPMTVFLIKSGLNIDAPEFATEDFTADMNIPTRNWLQTVFQEELGTLDQLQPVPTTDQIPQILVGTSRVMGVGLTLHNAAHLMKFDVDFLDGYDRQMIKRIWRIGQQRACYVWRYFTADSTEEVLIKMRQELRSGIVHEAYKLPSSDYDLEDGSD